MMRRVEIRRSDYIIGGIPIRTPGARHYLEGLWRTLREYYPEFAGQRKEIERKLGLSGGDPGSLQDASADLFVGYHKPARISPLIDRDWLARPSNGIVPLLEYVSEKKLFSGVRSAHVCGAGLCGLGDFLASLPAIESVVCSDLSWLELFIAKLIFEGKTDRLPRYFTRDRVFYDAARSHKSFARRIEKSVFRAPFSKPGKRPALEVRNFCRLGPETTQDLVCVPYVLDVLPAVRSAVIRLCEQLRRGQKLLVITEASGYSDASRDPEELLRILRACGLEPEFVDIVPMQYSCAPFEHGYGPAAHPTTVVLAKKLSDIDPSIITVKAPLAKRAVRIRAHSDEFELYMKETGESVAPLDADEAGILRFCGKSRPYSALLEHFHGKSDGGGFQDALARLMTYAAIQFDLTEGGRTVR